MRLDACGSSVMSTQPCSRVGKPQGHRTPPPHPRRGSCANVDAVGQKCCCSRWEKVGGKHGLDVDQNTDLPVLGVHKLRSKKPEKLRAVSPTRWRSSAGCCSGLT